ncbi:MAG: M23 family metallopeptidase [Myxococcota bacterium]
MNTSGLIVLLLLLLATAGGVALWFRAEGTPPLVVAPEAVLLGAGGTTLEIGVSDAESGLRDVRVRLLSGAEERSLLDESYPGNLLSGGVRPEHLASIPLDAKTLGKQPAQREIEIAVRDWSWRGFFSGNQTVVSVPLTIDVDPPRVAVETGLTYVKQGGAGAVTYRVSEEAARDGVQVGEHFYTGHPHPDGRDGHRVALFAVPADAASDVEIRVVAEDAAGNTGRGRWPVNVKPRSMPEGNVTLPQSFLDNVVPRLASDVGDDPAAAFHRVNTEVRAANEAAIRAALAEAPEKVPHFLPSGRLSQLANSAVTSRFAERRTYFVEGRPVSKAVHYGYDLAATAAADITAAAAGRVVHADDLGIYGNCVIVDHGLGLATLYGHLSRIDVAKGDRVEADQVLGLSGATGLAGGDHLHFAVLVGDTYVDPLEWWDAKWVETHVTPRLETPGA